MTVSTNNGRKNVNVLGLTPVQAQSTSILGLPPVAPPDIPENRAINRHERKIVAALHEDILIMEGTALKGEYGMYLLGQVQQCASDLFGGTISYMLENKNDVKGTEAEPYVAEFTLRQIQMYARQMLGATEIVGTRLGEQIHSSLDLPPEKPSLLERIFGSRD